MKQSAMPPLSVVVPTLNEAESLPMLLERIYNTLYAAHIPFEIIIIDDHSTDATAVVAREAAAKYHIRFILKDGKPGKAYSLQQGFQLARYDVICMIDADLQYPPEAINRMYHKLVYCNADIVITNRISQQTSILRKLSTRVFHLVFTRALFGIDYDTQSGLKLFKKRVLQDVTISPSPWTFDLEFIVRSLENKYVILSEDIIFAKRYAGAPKIHILSATFEMAWQSLKLRRKVAAKRVKVQYRQLQPLQQSFNWLAVLIIGLGLAGSVALARPVDALSLPTLPSLTKETTTKAKDTKKNTTVKTPVGTVTIPTPTPTTTPAGTDTSTPANTTSLAASTATPVSSATNTTDPSPSSSSAASTTSDSAAQPSTKPDTNLQTSNGANAPYYSASKLSNSRTSHWLSLALRIMEIGIGLVALALTIITIRGLLRKGNRAQDRRPVLSEQTR